MKIKDWHSYKDQICNLGKCSWRVPVLVQFAKDLPVFDMPLNHLNVYYTYERLTLREMVMHMKAVNDADLDIPIILDEDGEIMDGRHRAMKAMLLGLEAIKAVRFDENPNPCTVRE